MYRVEATQGEELWDIGQHAVRIGDHILFQRGCYVVDIVYDGDASEILKLVDDRIVVLPNSGEN